MDQMLNSLYKLAKRLWTNLADKVSEKNRVDDCCDSLLIPSIVYSKGYTEPVLKPNNKMIPSKGRSCLLLFQPPEIRCGKIATVHEFRSAG